MNKLVYVLLMVFFVTACETDDVDSSLGGPELSLTVEAVAISEDNGSTEINLALSESSDQAITVKLAFTGTAMGNGVDYSVSAASVTIAAGEILGTTSVTAVQDLEEEGDETIEVSIASADGARFDPLATSTIIIEDDDVQAQVKIILNEILYDPSNSGLEGDANGDGVYAQREDEFLEFVNLSTQALDVSGFEIYDEENLAMTPPVPNHIVPANTIIPPGKALVIFGGGSPTGSFGGAIVQTSSSGDLNLNNAGDIMTLMDASGNVILTFDIGPLSDNPNESYTRNPDLSGDFVQHGDISSFLFSPGTKIDGSSF